MPALLDHEVTAVYAGLRAASEHSDYWISVDEGYACVGGIRSTGLTGSMAIAEHVRSELGRAGVPLEPREDLPEVRMPNLGEAFPRPYQRADLIERDPEYGRIVCFCERVTRGEIRDALREPDPSAGPRRAPPAHARAPGPLSGLLLRGAAAGAAGAVSAGPPVVVGAGPAGLAAAVELRRRGVADVLLLDREAEAGGIPRHARTRASGCATCAGCSPAPPTRGPRSARARGGGGAADRDDGHRLAPEGRAGAHEPARPRDDRAGRRRAGHRLPRASPLGAARAGLAAAGGHDHRAAAAARVPAGPPAGRPRADRGRRARELLGHRDPRSRRERGRWAWPPSCRGTSRSSSSGPAPRCATGCRSGRAPP